MTAEIAELRREHMRVGARLSKVGACSNEAPELHARLVDLQYEIESKGGEVVPGLGNALLTLGTFGLVLILFAILCAALCPFFVDGPPHLIPTKIGPQQEAIIERAEQRADASGYPRGSEIWQRIYNASFDLPPPQTADETAKIEQRKQAEADLQSGCYKMAADCTPEELAYVNRIDAEQAAEKANAAEAAVAAKCDAIAVTLAHWYPVGSDYKVGEFSYRSCNPHNHLTVYRTAVLMVGILDIPIVGMTKIYEEQPRSDHPAPALEPLWETELQPA